MGRMNKTFRGILIGARSALAGGGLIQGAVLLPCLGPTAHAQTERDEQVRVEAEKHLRPCNTGAADIRRRCEANRQIFLASYSSAYAGNYQAQRMVARLLAAAPGTASAPSPSSAVIPNLLEACAWRTVMISTDSQDARDEARELRDCGRLTESERLASELRASELIAAIAHGPMRGSQAQPGDGAGS